jgi:hypothetical protein
MGGRLFPQLTRRSFRSSLNTQMAQPITRKLHNLTRRPAKPALGNGHVQKACCRALWALQTASTSRAAVRAIRLIYEN